MKRFLVYFEDEPGMTAPDDLVRTMDGLKELLRVAWSDLANPLLTLFARLEARNQIKRYGAELRRHLQMMEAMRNRIRQQSLEEHADHVPETPKLRFLA